MKSKKKHLSKQLGASLVEYGLLVALVAIIALPSLSTLGRQIKCKNFIASIPFGAPMPSNPSRFWYTFPSGFAAYIYADASNYNSCVNGNFAQWGL